MKVEEEKQYSENDFQNYLSIFNIVLSLDCYCVLLAFEVNQEEFLSTYRILSISPSISIQLATFIALFIEIFHFASVRSVLFS